MDKNKMANLIRKCSESDDTSALMALIKELKFYFTVVPYRVRSKGTMYKVVRNSDDVVLYARVKCQQNAYRLALDMLYTEKARVEKAIEAQLLEGKGNEL